MSTNVPTPAPSGPSPEAMNAAFSISSMDCWPSPPELDQVALIIDKHFSAAQLASAKRIEELEIKLTHREEVLTQADIAIGHLRAKLEAAQQQSERLAAALELIRNETTGNYSVLDGGHAVSIVMNVSARADEALRTYNERKDV